jgi:hypothetical protein
MGAWKEEEGGMTMATNGGTHRITVSGRAIVLTLRGTKGSDLLAHA